MQESTLSEGRVGIGPAGPPDGVPCTGAIGLPTIAPRARRGPGVAARAVITAKGPAKTGSRQIRKTEAKNRGCSAASLDHTNPVLSLGCVCEIKCIAVFSYYKYERVIRE